MEKDIKVQSLISPLKAFDLSFLVLFFFLKELISIITKYIFKKQ